MQHLDKCWTGNGEHHGTNCRRGLGLVVLLVCTGTLPFIIHTVCMTLNFRAAKISTVSEEGN